MTTADLLDHYDTLYAAAMRRTRRPYDAEDLVQETFAKAIASKRQFRSGSNLGGWLQRILVNTHVSNMRSARAQRERVDPESVEAMLAATWAEPAEAVAARRDTGNRVRSAVRGLPEQWRAPLVLHDAYGVSQREVAELLDMPEGTVASRVQRARKRLRKELAA